MIGRGLRTGELASAAGVNIQTIRYYERLGLLKPPARTRSGYRCYPDEAATLVKLIKEAQRLGFKLDEIKQFLSSKGTSTSEQVIHTMLTAKIGEVDQQIGELQQVRQRLETLRSACQCGASCSVMGMREGGLFRITARPSALAALTVVREAS